MNQGYPTKKRTLFLCIPFHYCYYRGGCNLSCIRLLLTCTLQLPYSKWQRYSMELLAVTKYASRKGAVTSKRN